MFDQDCMSRTARSKFGPGRQNMVFFGITIFWPTFIEVTIFELPVVVLEVELLISLRLIEREISENDGDRI